MKPFRLLYKFLLLFLILCSTMGLFDLAIGIMWVRLAIRVNIVNAPFYVTGIISLLATIYIGKFLKTFYSTRIVVRKR